MKGEIDKRMKPKWIKVGDSEKDIFDILGQFEHGKTVVEIADCQKLPLEEIQRLLLRTKKYLRDHLILDSYLETTNKLVSISTETSQQEWTSREIQELTELTSNGAKLKNIVAIMRKEKIDSLNLQVKGD